MVVEYKSFFYEKSQANREGTYLEDIYHVLEFDCGNGFGDGYIDFGDGSGDGHSITFEAVGVNQFDDGDGWGG